VRSRIASALALLALSASGARSGLADDGLGPADGGDSDAGHDAEVPDLPDAGDEPLACDGRPLPRPGAIVAAAMPARMHALGVLIPDPLGLILVGGRTSSDEAAEQMAFLDLTTNRSQELPVEGDDVVLPDRDAVAVYVPEADQVIVIGGSGPDGAPTDQAFAFTGEGDPSGLRRVRARLLPSFPGGPVRGHVGVWDPVAGRVIVHGGAGLPDEPSDTRTTWSLRLGADPTWQELVAAEDSPPPGTRAMGYDPEHHRAIEITDDDDGDGVAVFGADLDNDPPFWTRMDEVELVPSTRGELVWDDAACGFHVLSARRTRCVLEHWILTLEPGLGLVYRGELELSPSHFLAASTFVPALDELVIYGSEDCGSPGTPNLMAHEVALVR
jgi:hypothetical protein